MFPFSHARPSLAVLATALVCGCSSQSGSISPSTTGALSHAVQHAPAPEVTSDSVVWARVGAGGMAKKVAATIRITSPGRPAKEQGTGPLLVVEGDPGELTVFGSGRQAAARVEITGDSALADQLRSVPLGI